MSKPSKKTQIKEILLKKAQSPSGINDYAISLNDLPFQLPRSEATTFILNIWRINGIINIQEARAAYKALSPDTTTRGSTFTVHRFLTTRGRRIKQGIYQLLTQQHINNGIYPISYINEKGTLVKTKNSLPLTP